MVYPQSSQYPARPHTPVPEAQDDHYPYTHYIDDSETGAYRLSLGDFELGLWFGFVNGGR